MKWRTTPFPRYDDMAEILGETQGTGRYSFQFGAEDAGPNEANADPIIDLEAAAGHDDDDSPEDTPVETHAERRHRESSKLQPPPNKKQKVSGGSLRLVAGYMFWRTQLYRKIAPSPLGKQCHKIQWTLLSKAKP